MLTESGLESGARPRVQDPEEQAFALQQLA